MVLEQRIHPNFFLCYTYLYPLLFAQSTKPTLALPHTLVLSIDLCFFFTLFRFSISNGRRHHQRLFTDRTAVTTSLTSTLSQKNTPLTHFLTGTERTMLSLTDVNMTGFWRHIAHHTHTKPTLSMSSTAQFLPTRCLIKCF